MNGKNGKNGKNRANGANGAMEAWNIYRTIDTPNRVVSDTYVRTLVLTSVSLTRGGVFFGSEVPSAAFLLWECKDPEDNLERFYNLLDRLVLLISIPDRFG